VSNEIDREAVTDERLAEMIADWENTSAASASHDLDTKFADEHAAALRELQRLRSTPDAGRCERDARIADLERRLKEAERDAERYRWLRHGDNDENVLLVYDKGRVRKFGASYDNFWLLRDESLDTAIDAAKGDGQ
jgi:hypothetical protein